MANPLPEPPSSVVVGATVGEPITTLVDRLVEEMADAWQRGERPRAEAFLERLDGFRDEDAVRIVYEEACLRQERGEEAISSEILGRFPQYRSRLAILLDCNRLLGAPSAIDFPEAGDDLGDFRLLAEIGRGALGRTYLASQVSLGHRLMVLKVTPLGQEEHLSLARLQHMHIVPLYFEQVLPDRNLRLLGMPYLGGATLARVLETLRETPAPQRNGGQILDALDRSAVALPTEFPAGGPFRKFLAQASYVQALCWLGACLADALQYAHDRGLVHLDVKPSNVLIAGDGQPMLLDFHLARGPIGPGLAVPDRLGGTPGHLSPEQHAAMAAIQSGRVPTIPVDGRSDIYSLGLLLNEALGGDPVTLNQPLGRPLEECNPRVSPGLSDIVRNCLAGEPAVRYSDAASLAIDLRRHLNDLPLRGVANRSPIERWRKWRRRHPAAIASGLLRLAWIAAVIVGIAVSIIQLRQSDRNTEAALVESHEHLRNHRYSEATQALVNGLALTRHLAADDPRRHALNTALQRVLRTKTAAELHELVNLLRFRFGTGTPGSDEAQALLGRGLELWNARDLLTKPGDEPLAPATETQIQSDLVDLATVWADLRVQLASRQETKQALRDAVNVLRDAEIRFGPSPALSRDLRSYAHALGRTDIPAIDLPAPRTAWEHYELGRSYLRSNEHALAEREFQKAVALRPGEFWPYFSQAACAYHLKRYEDAVQLMSVCVALAPETAECYYNRAVVHEALGHTEPAKTDYTRALELNPRLSDAALNRGVLSLHAGRYMDAANDFKSAQLNAATGSRPNSKTPPAVPSSRPPWPISPATTGRPPAPVSVKPPNAATPPRAGSPPGSAWSDNHKLAPRQTRSSLNKSRPTCV